MEQKFGYVEIGKSEGVGVLVTGGGQLKRNDAAGFYMALALLTDTTASMRINRENLFRPVASIIRVKGYEELWQEPFVACTPFGLSAGVPPPAPNTPPT
ncbi:MAG: aldehyde dehydrogenase family protein [Rhodoferax sp.]|nr:aldehyde dehydrogenase family protein [Rhodoferax sp.]